VVEIVARVPVSIGQDLTSMHHDPEPHPLCRRRVLVVFHQATDEGGDERMQQSRGRDLSVDQQQQPVADVVTDGQVWADLGLGKGIIHQAMQPTAQPDADRVRPGFASETLDVDRKNPTMGWFVRHPWNHLSNPYEQNPPTGSEPMSPRRQPEARRSESQ
jgi:hypothetical protein